MYRQIHTSEEETDLSELLVGVEICFLNRMNEAMDLLSVGLPSFFFHHTHLLGVLKEF